jgi:hypothetical protein
MEVLFLSLLAVALVSLHVPRQVPLGHLHSRGPFLLGVWQMLSIIVLLITMKLTRATKGFLNLEGNLQPVDDISISEQ